MLSIWLTIKDYFRRVKREQPIATSPRNRFDQWKFVLHIERMLRHIQIQIQIQILFKVGCVYITSNISYE